MNQPEKELLRQLELATSSESTADRLDDETAALREGWLMLGRLIEVAEADSEALVPAVRPAAARIRKWPFALAIAAGLLIALLSWSIVWRQASSESTPEIAESIEDADKNDSGGGVEAAAKGRNSEAAFAGTDSASEFAWDDEFDEVLTKASVAIHSARSDWSNGEAGYASLSDRFEEFEQELEEGSL
jgi:hypothetical protein